MSKCLITGGTGLIGANLIKALAHNHELFVLSQKPQQDLVKFQGLPLTLLQEDLNTLEWSCKLPNEIDIIIHLAQSHHFREFPSKAEEIFRVNTYSMVKLLDYALKARAKTFLHTSTGGVYGSGNKPFSSELPLRLKHDLGFYQSTKLCSELIAQSYSPYYNVITLRPFFVYGREQRRDMLIPRLVDNIITGKPIRLQGQEGLRINPIHVSDAVRIIKAALSLDQSHLLNIAGKETFSLRQIGEIIGHKVLKTPIFDVFPNEEPPNMIGDINKTVELLGLEPLTPLGEAINEVIEASPHELSSNLSRCAT